VFITAVGEDVASAYMSATAPVGAKPGDLWYDLNTGTLAIYINDGNSSQWVQVGLGGSTSILPKGYLYGLTLSNNATDVVNDIDFAVGEAVDDSFAINMVLASILTKRLDATWVVGTNQGGLDGGTIANTTYHAFLIRRPDTGVVDALFSTSAVAPVMPASYTQKRRIMSILRVGGSIVPFTQNGDEVLRMTPVSDFAAVSAGTAAVLRTLSVPLGIKVTAIVSIGTANGAGEDARGLVTSPDVNDTLPTAGNTWNYGSSSSSVQLWSDPQLIRTNTSGQIRTRNTASSATISVFGVTHGWIDTRGRLG
jgi:hypothetical protein